MYYSHLVTIKQLAETYQQQQPLALFLKSYFRTHKKYGSRDRKNIMQHIFNYYRLGKALPEADFQTRLQVATYLVDNIIIDEKLNSEKPLVSSDDLEERMASVKNQFSEFNIESIFPFSDELSNGVDSISFAKSILKRPKVFIRIRKGYEKKVTEEFQELAFQFEIINANTFAFTQETKITAATSFEKGWFEIQDLSSQLTGNFFEARPDEHWWDCCAGAGGKSLLFKEKHPDTYLLISDARESILVNALARLKKTGVKKYKIETNDVLAKLGNPDIWISGNWEIRKLGNSEIEVKEGHTELSKGAQTPNQFDGIIVDAPCSGSGTWARTPENISFFKKEMIEEFQSKQIAIVENVLQFLKPGGQLIYITCSAFKKENEEVIQLLLETGNLKLIREQIFLGYEKSGDVMYAAHFEKKT